MLPVTKVWREAEVLPQSGVIDVSPETRSNWEMGAPKAPAGGFAGYAKALAAEAKKPTVRFADTPIGQSVLWSAAKSVKTLPAPLLDAWANKDPDAAKKAVADDLFGGSP